MKPGDLPHLTLRDGIGGVVAVLVIGALCWSALHDQSQSSQTALVGAAGAVDTLDMGLHGRSPWIATIAQ